MGSFVERDFQRRLKKEITEHLQKKIKAKSDAAVLRRSMREWEKLVPVTESTELRLRRRRQWFCLVLRLLCLDTQLLQHYYASTTES